MAHKMGLLTANITTSTTEVDNVITYDGNSWNGTTWTSSTSTKLYYLPSRTFSSGSRTPYISSNTLYYIGKPSDTTIGFVASAIETGTLYYAWTLTNVTTPSNTTIASAGQYKPMTIPAYSGRLFRQKIWNFSYAGSGKTWNAPHAGTYTMECWGAQGSQLSGTYSGWNSYSLTYTGGKGGYTKGDLSLAQNKSLYIYVGNNSLVGPTTNYGNSANQPCGFSFNGGGYISCTYGTKCGGGATDIRVKSGNWNDFTSQKSRIMVAAGGGSAGDRGNGYGGGSGGYAGGLTGQDSQIDSRSRDVSSLSWYAWIGTGGSQTGTRAGITWDAKDGKKPSWGSSIEAMVGVFGSGMYGQDGEGGGGWYGGCAAGHASGAGGSSYISGFTGCRAIKQSATVNTGGEAYHESGSVATIDGQSYTFSNPEIWDGNGYKWNSSAATSTRGFKSPSGSAENGHTGNGYARITYTN